MGKRGPKPGQKRKQEPYDQKTAKLTPEEQAIREENLKARGNWQANAVHSLCSKICLNTISDYRKLLRQLRKNVYDLHNAYRTQREKKKIESNIEKIKEELEDCEEFFDSDMFTMCTGVSGREEAIRKIKAVPDGYDHLLEGRNIG